MIQHHRLISRIPIILIKLHEMYRQKLHSFDMKINEVEKWRNKGTEKFNIRPVWPLSLANDIVYTCTICTSNQINNMISVLKISEYLDFSHHILSFTLNCSWPVKCMVASIPVIWQSINSKVSLHFWGPLWFYTFLTSYENKKIGTFCNYYYIFCMFRGEHEGKGDSSDHMNGLHLARNSKFFER